MAGNSIGSKISLVSNAGIRYEGTLWKLDPTYSTISLAQVRSFGTEDRRRNKIAPSKNVYEFVVFRGSDIKDIVVAPPGLKVVDLMKSSHPANTETYKASGTAGKGRNVSRGHGSGISTDGEKKTAFPVVPDYDYDFDRSNRQMQEKEEKLNKQHDQNGFDMIGQICSAPEKEEPVIYYDPKKFYDLISSDNLEKKDVRRPVYDRNKEREINAVTFGIPLPPVKGNNIVQKQNQRGRQNNQNSKGHGVIVCTQGGSRQRHVATTKQPGRPNPPMKMPTEMKGDWVYDPKEKIWVNYKNPIRSRNQILIDFIMGKGSQPPRFQQPGKQPQKSNSFRRMKTDGAKPADIKKMAEIFGKIQNSGQTQQRK
jgi:hypothetical protein